ncbi:MAG: SPOR domain-containing protein [Hyphomicrobiales bacterium]|nr:SPOR domain-containing protein [Hyphomicrobiales bacterium]
MAEPSTRAPFAVSLEEFERRLRGPAAPSGVAALDPLAALAQLVGDEGKTQNNRQGLFATGAEGRAAARAQPSPAPAPAPGPAAAAPKAPSVQQNFAEQLRALHAHHDAMRRALVDGRPLDSPADDEGEVPHAESSEAELHIRGFEESFAGAGVGVAQDAHAAPEWNFEPPAESFEPQAERPSVYAATQADATNARRASPLIYMGSIFAVSFLVLGGIFAYRHGGAHAEMGGVPLIKADSTPVRIVPAKPEGVVVANQNTDILDSGKQKAIDAANLAKDKVVANLEQPDDLNALPKSTAKAPATSAQTVTSAVVAPPAVASSAPNPQAAQDQGQVTAAATAPDANANTSGDVHQVHTVLVQPNSSLGALAPAAPPAAVAMNAPVKPAPHKPAPAHLVKPEAAKAHDIKAHDIKAHVAKPAPRPQLALRKPVHAAPARNAPLQLVPSPIRARQKPQQVASLAKPAGGARGFFAVQLAAPGTEAGAKSMMARLSARYGSALQGHHLGYHRVSLNGHDVFRVRVDHVDRIAALSICKAIRGKGGSCWISAD